MTTLATLSFDYPLEFWVTVLVLLGLVVDAVRSFPRKFWAIPALLVYGTIAVWYLGNLVNEGPEAFRALYGDSLPKQALGQVILFLLAYRGFVQWLVPRTDDPAAQTSVASRLHPAVVVKFFRLLFFAWLILFAIGLVTVNGAFLAIVWPPSSPIKIGMFGRGAIGGGGDFLRSAAGYVYVLVCALFGTIFILAKDVRRWQALLLILFTWPYFWFDRTRNIMLATLLPAVFCYWVATHGIWWKKLAVSLVLFGCVGLWFNQVMRYRGAGEYQMESIMDFSGDGGENGESNGQGLLGLDMLGELCYMDHFIATGTYSVNWGQRYFAEIANVVPRTIWANKPLIGFDYAYARGFQDENSAAESVYATISTGMIGQGVANFGRIFGVVAAALLMALWTKLLAKLWRQRFELPRFLLFLVGCGLTFNMGRDITLLVLWPFVFGYGLVVLIERYHPLTVIPTGAGKPPWLHQRGATPAGPAPALSHRPRH